MESKSTYKPPTSVWTLIKQHVPTEELGLVRSCIGEAKLDYCIDLENELNVLLEIWREMTVDSTNATPISNNSPSSSIIAEPPHLREMLTKEIQLLLQSIREKNINNKYEIKKQGNLNDCNKSILSYAINASKVFHNGKIHCSETPQRPATPLLINNDLSVDSTENIINDTSIKYVAKEINAVNIDRVSFALNKALEQECEALLKGINFLQACIEEENENFPLTNFPETEPSISELRKECKKLEEELLKDSVITSANKTFPSKNKSFLQNRPSSAPLTSTALSLSANVTCNIKNNITFLSPLPPTKEKPIIRHSGYKRKHLMISEQKNNNSPIVIDMKSIIKPISNIKPRPPSCVKPINK